jgi:hypothetical protein
MQQEFGEGGYTIESITKSHSRLESAAMFHLVFYVFKIDTWDLICHCSHFNHC